MLDAQLDKAVVNHDGVAGLDVLGQTGIIDAADLLIAGNIAGRQGIDRAVCDLHGAAGKCPQPNLRPLGIEHGCNREPKLLAQTHDLLKPDFIFFVIRMGKIKTGNIHAGLHHLPEHLILIGCRTDGTDDLCFSELLLHGNLSFLPGFRCVFSSFIIPHPDIQVNHPARDCTYSFPVFTLELKYNA